MATTDAKLADLASDQLAAQVGKAKSFSVDGMSRTNRDIGELIALEKHVSRKRANRFGFGIAVVTPGGH